VTLERAGNHREVKARLPARKALEAAEAWLGKIERAEKRAGGAAKPAAKKAAAKKK